MSRICIEIVDLDSPVRLHQTGFNEFSVEYGRSWKQGLCYADACAELGAALMHSAACAGQLDNRTKDEARQAGDRKPYFAAA